MDNKFNNMINEFLANTDAKDEKELNAKLQEFIMKYNMGLIEYKNTPLDDAYDILKKAEEAKNEEEAIKYAKEAYEKCSACFDAILFQVDLEKDSLKRCKLLDEGIKFEEDRLRKEGYFKKDNIGHFYGIFETRPYIRGLYAKAGYLVGDGKIKQACLLCNEILKLNKHDNLGARYLLMAIYAYLEEKNDMLKLYKKYPEEDLEMLIPLFILYYKQDNDNKAKEYLDRINNANSHFIEVFKGNIEKDDDAMDGYYSRGDSSEVIMYFDTYDFLIRSVPNIDCYVLENSKDKETLS